MKREIISVYNYTKIVDANGFQHLSLNVYKPRHNIKQFDIPFKYTDLRYPV